MGQRIPLICIVGPSAAGKTHFSHRLAEALKDVGVRILVLASDDYYRQNWCPDPVYGFDTIAAIDSEALIGDLQCLQRRSLRQRRRYDMATRSVSWDPLSAVWDMVILEGAFGPQILLERMPPDVLIYLEVSLGRRVLRRLRRDTRERGRSLPVVLEQTFTNMIAGERRFITPLKQRADVVIRNPRRDLSRVIDLIDQL